MLDRIKNRKQEGFTIIEVLIVLAIAGLILLIVFLAVPALQRNARNTTLKNDASSFASGFSEYESNNAGAAPTAVLTPESGQATIGAAGTSQSNVKVNGSTVITTAPVAAAPSTYTTSTLYWGKIGKTCDGSTSTRAIVVYYWAESSGTPATPQCVDAG